MTSQLKIKINPEYQKLIPEIPAQEFAAFKADINERGQLVPITVNNQGIILDGHHRYRACQELGIECHYLKINFANELLEKLFVIDSNLKRRHLNSFQRGELALKEKPILEEIAKTNSKANLKQNYANILSNTGSYIHWSFYLSCILGENCRYHRLDALEQTEVVPNRFVYCYNLCGGTRSYWTYYTHVIIFPFVNIECPPHAGRY